MHSTASNIDKEPYELSVKYLRVQEFCKIVVECLVPNCLPGLLSLCEGIGSGYPGTWSLQSQGTVISLHNINIVREGADKAGNL